MIRRDNSFRVIRIRYGDDLLIPLGLLTVMVFAHIS